MEEEHITELPQENMQEENIEEIQEVLENEIENHEENSQSTVENVKETYSKTKYIFRVILFIVKTLATMIATPTTWIIIFITLILVTFYSSSFILGPVQFGSVCQSNGAPSIEMIAEPEDRNGVISGFFAGDDNISNSAAAYLGLIAEENGNDFTISSNVPELCDTACLMARIQSGTFPSNIKLGVFQLSGENAASLVIRAHNEGKEWSDSSVQLATVKSIISSASQGNSAISNNQNSRESIQAINQALGIKPLLTGQDLERYSRDATERAQHIAGDPSGCSVMGTGRGRGRLAGGSATDNRAGGGTLDASSLIAFLESYNSSTKISTPGNFGYESATPEMIAAKQMAESATGADPGGNIYASCDRNVAIALRAMGVDPSYPWGAVVHQVQYMESQTGKWTKVDNCDRQSGDVVTWGTGHIAIYGINDSGEEMIYQASFQDYLPYKSKAFSCSYAGDGRPIQYWRYIGG